MQLDLNSTRANEMRARIDEGEQLSEAEYRKLAHAYVASRGWHTDEGWLARRCDAVDAHSSSDPVIAPEDFCLKMDAIFTPVAGKNFLPHNAIPKAEDAVLLYLQGRAQAVVVELDKLHKNGRPAHRTVDER